MSARSGHAQHDSEPYGPLAVFARVLGYIERSYVRAIPVERLVYAAIQGMVDELDEPSVFLSPKEFSALRKEARPVVGGIGVVMTKRAERVVIVEVHRETSAARAGIEPGDTLLAVDGWPVGGASSTQITERITGVPGTSVKLRILPRAGGSARELRLVRMRIFRSTVVARRFGPFGYLRMLRFDERATRDLLRGLEFVAEGEAMAGLVLDLRGNPGGLLDQAVATADVWLEDGVIVSTSGRNRKDDTATARPGQTKIDYPLAVLVDDGTASAAEIVAGALQDHGRGRVFGRRTFGKGSVQTLIELEDGSALKLTVARYFTPLGRSIDGQGIEPDVAVEESSENFRLGAPDRDQSLATALGWLSNRSGRPFRPSASAAYPSVEKRGRP